MNRFLIVFLLITSYTLDAQVLPAEGSRLNYRIIGFMVPKRAPGFKYKIQIALGHYTNTASFERHIIDSFECDESRITGEVPFLGKEYTWRDVSANINSVKIPGRLHYFSTMTVKEVDTNFTRLRVTTEAETYKDAYIFSDASRTLYDMKGKPVWFLPKFDAGAKRDEKIYGDFKATDDGTITFGRIGYKDEQLFEANYNGDILWKSYNTSCGCSKQKHY